MDNRFQILTDVQLTDYIQYLIDDDTKPCRLVVCTSKETFIEQLLAACTEPQANDVAARPNPNPGYETTEAETDGIKESEPHELLRPPSLLRLASSQSVKLAFCPSLSHLRAYLAALAVPKSSQPVDIHGPTNIEHARGRPPLLAILNPIDIHRSTSSFSAQGFNRTFALAVEAAYATKSQLLMAECPSLRSSEIEQDAGIDYEADFPPPQPALENPWDEEVSMLNVTTKSFGAGGRGWVGRTVSLRRIAERWLVFSAFQRDEEGVE